jgi:hypothetical protein
MKISPHPKIEPGLTLMSGDRAVMLPQNVVKGIREKENVHANGKSIK